MLKNIENEGEVMKTSGEVMQCYDFGKLASFRVGLQGLCRQTAFGVEESVWIKQHDSFIAGSPALGWLILKAEFDEAGKDLARAVRMRWLLCWFSVSLYIHLYGVKKLIIEKWNNRER